MSNKKTKRSKKSSSSKSVSPTALLMQGADNGKELKNKKQGIVKKEVSLEKNPEKQNVSTRNNLQSALEEAILRLEPISEQVKNNQASKEDLETAINEVIESLAPVSEDKKNYSLSKADLQQVITDAKANLKKVPENGGAKKVLKKDLETAVQNAIVSLKPISDSEKKHTLSKQDLEIAIKDVMSSLKPVAEEEVRHALTKQNLQTEIKNAKESLVALEAEEKKHALEKQDLQLEIKNVKAGLKKISDSEKRHALTKQDTKTRLIEERSALKPVVEEVRRPKLSSKQLRSASKDNRVQLHSVPEDLSTANLSLGETIKKAGDQIKRDLLPIPGDVEIFEVKDIQHLKEYSADKTEYNNLLNYLLKEEKKPLLKFTINTRTKFNRIEFIDEKNPVSVDNLIAGGDLVQFGQAYRFLLKFGYIRIDNPYPHLLSEDQWYVWNLKEEIDLTFVDIAYARNCSVRDVRSIFHDADDRIQQILDFVVQGGHYQLVAAHAMKNRGILIQQVGDNVIEQKFDNYTAEEYLLSEMKQVSKDQEQEKVPREWPIKAAYKRESLIGGKYLWKEWLGSLNNDKLLLMENYELPNEESYLRESIGFGAYETPDIVSNFEKLISIFKNVPEELLKIGNTAYFLGNIDGIYASQFWNINSFVEEDGLAKWRKQFIKFAIKAYKTALKKYTVTKNPLKFAKAQNDLGNFYSSLSEIEQKLENCKLAIEAYKESLKVFSAELFRFEYSHVNFNLGLAYQTLAELEDVEINSKLAILSYQEAIKGRDLINYPFENALTLVNLGVAYQTLASIAEKASYSTFAVDSYNSSLRTGSLDKMLTERAMIYSNLGVSYKILAKAQELKHNCSQAILVLNDSLTVRNEAQFPFEYAITTSILGDVYRILAEVENKKENCSLAISAYNKSTKIFIKKYQEFYNDVINRKKAIVAFSKTEVGENNK